MKAIIKSALVDEGRRQISKGIKKRKKPSQQSNIDNNIIDRYNIHVSPEPSASSPPSKNNLENDKVLLMILRLNSFESPAIMVGCINNGIMLVQTERVNELGTACTNILC